MKYGDLDKGAHLFIFLIKQHYFFFLKNPVFITDPIISRYRRNVHFLVKMVITNAKPTHGISFEST